MVQRVTLDDILEPVSHYCHVVEANGIVWVSGLVGMKADGSIPADTAAQFDIALADMDKCLKAVGANVSDVTKVRIFVTDIADRAAINPARQAYFGDHRPASTLVEVSALVDPRMTVEIEAEAVIGG